MEGGLEKLAVINVDRRPLFQSEEDISAISKHLWVTHGEQRCLRNVFADWQTAEVSKK